MSTETPTQEDRLRMRSLRAQVGKELADGSVPCPDCGNPPHGMQKREGTDTAPPQFEVGCLHCPDHRARGWSREQAVQKWNQGAQSDSREGWVKPQQP